MADSIHIHTNNLAQNDQVNYFIYKLTFCFWLGSFGDTLIKKKFNF